jgi:glycosyltransferase
MKVSIITVSHNSVNTIGATISCIASQTYTDIEYIVVDGHSDDGTLEVIQSFDEQISYWISEPDKGIYDALNKGIDAATGDVIGILNSDDIYVNDYVVQKVVDTFNQEKTDCVYGDLVYVDRYKTNNIIRYWKAGLFEKNRLKRGWMPPHPTVFLMRDIYKKYGKFDTNYQIAADYDFMLRFLGSPNISVSYIPEVLVKMRVGGDSNKSIRNIFRKSREDYRAIRKNNVRGGISTILLKNLLKIPQFFTRPET